MSTRQAYTNFCSAEHPARRMKGSGVCRGKGAPGLPSSSLQPCTSIERTISLRQTRSADMPDPSNPFASRLAGARITRIGVEWVPVVRDLIAVGIRYDR